MESWGRKDLISLILVERAAASLLSPAEGAGQETEDVQILHPGTVSSSPQAEQKPAHAPDCDQKACAAEDGAMDQFDSQLFSTLTGG